MQLEMATFGLPEDQHKTGRPDAYQQRQDTRQVQPSTLCLYIHNLLVIVFVQPEMIDIVLVPPRRTFDPCTAFSLN